MPSSHRINLLIILLLCIVCTGCEATRRRFAHNENEKQNLVVSKPVSLQEFESKSKKDNVFDSSSTKVLPVNFSGEKTVSTLNETASYKSADIIDASSVSLEQMQSIALQNNPTIKQINATASRASGLQHQVGLDTNPSIGYFAEEIGNENAGGLHGIFVSKTFVNGEKLEWNQQVLGHDVNTLRWQAETQGYRVKTDIRILYYRALAAQRRIELAKEFKVVAEKGLSIAEQRKEALIGTVPDILQAEIQLNQVELEIQNSHYDFEAAWKEMVAIAGVPSMSSTKLNGRLDSLGKPRNLETTYSQILSESPLLQAANSQVCRARSNWQRQKIQSKSNVTAQLGVGHDDATGDEFANVQLSIPLRVNNVNQGNIRAAYSQYCEATQNVKRLELQVRQNLAKVYRKYQTALATVERYENVIQPKANQSLKLTQEAYVAQEFSFLRVMTARKNYFDINLQHLKALSDLVIADAEIEGLLLTGGLANNVQFNVDDSLRSQALNNQ